MRNGMWFTPIPGYENTVKATIEKAVENRNLRRPDPWRSASLWRPSPRSPTTAAKTVERKVFPGYVLVKMVMTDETWHLVRNIRGVTGFVGSGNKPIPLTEDGDRRPGRGKARGRGGLSGGRQRQASPTARWSPSWAPWKRSTLERQQGPGGGLHVRPGDPGGTGAGSGRVHDR